MYVLERVQHRVPEEALKVSVKQAHGLGKPRFAELAVRARTHSLLFSAPALVCFPDTFPRLLSHPLLAAGAVNQCCLACPAGWPGPAGEK